MVRLISVGVDDFVWSLSGVEYGAVDLLEKTGAMIVDSRGASALLTNFMLVEP